MALSVGATRTISFLWGFAEATFFFLVPDIWLSRVVLLYPLKEGIINIAIATLGAVIGGVLMYFAAVQAFDVLYEFMPFIPAISSEMVMEVGRNVEDQSLLYAMGAGMFAGVPYKLYALWSGYLSVPLWLFAGATIIARLSRFLSVSILAYLIGRVLKPKLSLQAVLHIHLFTWICFYGLYFYMMGF